MVNLLSQKIITGRITNYRIGIRTQQSKECLIEFNGFNSSLAGQIVGKKVTWSHAKKKLTGKIMGFHGKNGAVRVKFGTPIPGQAIGTTVELIL
jgi:ribosomal protein L35AE/L33A